MEKLNLKRKKCSNNNSDDLFDLIRLEGDNYHPLLLFLIGVNYGKFSVLFEDKLFIRILIKIQNKITKETLDEDQVMKTFKRLLNQNRISKVFELDWLNKHLSWVSKYEKNHDYKNYEEEKEQIISNHNDDEYHFYENWNEKEEKKDKMKKKEKMSSNPFTDSQYAREIQVDEQIKSLKKSEEANENNKPGCQICLDKINYDEICALDCGHMYHTHCVAQHVKIKISEKSFPIVCPDVSCKQELKQNEVESLCEGDDYRKLVDFQFDNFIETHSDFYMHCPAPNCKFVFEWDDVKENKKFKCSECNIDYCVMCRVKWHEGIDCNAYRNLNRYPPEDRAFYNFLKDSRVKKCSSCGYFVEKSEGCNHMTCRCGYEFCYMCGGKYKQCTHC